MLIFTERTREYAASRGELRLTYEWRQKSRCRVTVARGELAGTEVGLRLERGTVLRDGDRVHSQDGVVLSIVAATEQLLHVTAGDAGTLLRIAYHLGNRHVPVQVGVDDAGHWMRLQLDHVLENMVEGLAGQASVVSAAFDPEQGAYGAHVHPAPPADESPAVGRHDDRRHAPKIHDFTDDQR